MVLLLAAGKVAGAAGVFWWWVAWGCLAACWWWVAGLPVWLPVLTAGWLSVGLKGLAACWAACTLGLWGSCLDAGLAMHCCFPRCCGSPHFCCGGPFLWDRFRASPGACKVPSKRARRPVVPLIAAAATRFSGTAFGLRPALAKSRRNGHAGTQTQRGDTLPEPA